VTGFDPIATLTAVDEGADRLEKAADVVAEAIHRFETAEANYKRAVEKQLLVVHDRAKKAGERTPAEDLRTAMAHNAIDPEVYAEYLQAKAHHESVKAKERLLRAAVSARQSLLKATGGA
jgi:hypothetical protein